jgi:4-oxalocrotonate tautomerase
VWALTDGRYIGGKPFAGPATLLDTLGRSAATYQEN